MQAPVVDRSIGIGHSQWGIGDDKFRSVRHRAQEERQELKHRSKKDKTVQVPKHAPGDKVVITVGYKARDYRLVEIVDFHESWRGRYEYYGILLKTTNKKEIPRIGRLCTFAGGRFGLSSGVEAGVEEKDIKWLDEEGEDYGTRKSIGQT